MKKGDISLIMKNWKALSAKIIIENCSITHPNWINPFYISARRYKRAIKQNYQVWQPRFDEHAIRTVEQFRTKINYIHGNPLKHLLAENCEDYPYSSIHDYLGGKNSFVEIELWKE
jgi:hypothetical protein